MVQQAAQEHIMAGRGEATSYELDHDSVCCLQEEKYWDLYSKQMAIKLAALHLQLDIQDAKPSFNDD